MQPAAIPETFTAFSIQDGGAAQRFVRLHDCATLRLETHVASQQRAQGEWGGVLWGSIHVDAAAGEQWIDVLDAEPVHCDRVHATFANCPVRCFEKALRAQPRNGHRRLVLVGYYRNGADHGFRKDDEQVFGAHFPSGERLALVIRALKDEVPTGIWYLGIGGRLRHQRATVEFPVSLNALTGTEPEPVLELPPAAPAVAGMEKAAPPSRSSGRLIAVAGLVIAGGIGAGAWFQFVPAPAAAPLAQPAPPPVKAAPLPSTVIEPPVSARVIRRATPVTEDVSAAAVVDVRVDLDATGRVLTATALNASLSDEAAVAAALAAARKSLYEPARNGGQPAAGQVMLRFRFQGDGLSLPNPPRR